MRTKDEHRRTLSIGARLIVLLAVALAAALCAAAGATPASAASPSSSPGTTVLRVGWTQEPDNLNPFIGYANTTFEFYALQYQYLFGFGVDGQPTLDLAAEFPTKANGGISADGLVWTVKIKKGVRWQDGKPLTADDVAFTYNYAIDNQMANLSVQVVNIKHVEVVDRYTVRIICSKPKADMEYLFVPILPEHIWAKVDPQEAERSYVNKPPIVGSGPYQAVEFKKGGYLEMVRNPYYSGKKPAVDEIVFQMYENADTMSADLKAGNIDAAWGILPAQFTELKSLSGLQCVNYIFYNWDFLDFNCYTGKSHGNPVLRDRHFRHAIGYAIDREKLAAIALGGYAEEGTTILPPHTWFSPDYHWQPSEAEKYTFDLDKADKLLTAAGYPRDKSGARLYQGKQITLRLWAKADTVQEQTEAKLIAGWLQKLGIKIHMSVVDLGALFDGEYNYDGDTYAPDFDILVSDWLGFTDPGQTLSCFTTSTLGSVNEMAWSNKEYDKLAEQQASALDPQQRKQLIWRMQQIMYQQAPWLVLTYPDLFEAYNTQKWTGWTRVMQGKGPAFMMGGNIDSYLNLKPRTAAETSSTGGSSTGWIVAVVVVVVVVAVALVVWDRRRRGRSVEE